MPATKHVWVNGDLTKPVNATRLNEMEAGIQMGLHLSNPVAQMTAALAAANPEALFFAPDDNGGAVYRSDGAGWTKIGAAALAALIDANIANPGDQQTLIFNGATGKWINGAAPVSGRELAYAENVTGTPTSAAAPSGGNSALTDIPGCNIAVPQNAGPVWIFGRAFILQTVAGAGQGQLSIVETTGGTSTTINTDTRILPNSVAAKQSNIGVMNVAFRAGAVPAGGRTFKLSIMAQAVAGATPTIQAYNNPGVGGLQSIIWAEAKS